MIITRINIVRLAIAAPFALLLGMNVVQAENTSNNTSSNQSTNTSSDRWSINSSPNSSSNFSNSWGRSPDFRSDARIDERGGKPGIYRYDYFKYERSDRGVWRSRHTKRGYRY